MKPLVISMFLLLFALPLQSQVTLGVWGGFGQSDITFENVVIGKQSGYVPVGVQFLFGNTFQIGAEVNYAVIPFTFNWKEDGEDAQSMEFKMNQLLLGGVAKLHFSTGAVRPYIRAGAGLYGGDVELEWSESAQELGYENVEIDMGEELGFNVGFGIASMMSSMMDFFIEANYHLVNRENNETEIMRGIGKIGANNWAVHVGVKFYF